MGFLIAYPDMMHSILAVVVQALSPHISPASCCGQRCTAPSGVFSPRGARRTVEYALRAPQVENPAGCGTSPPSRRNPVRYAG